MEAIQLHRIKENKAIYTNKELESILTHLMIQFRQIDGKYGLMVSREISKLYDNQSQFITYSQKNIDRSIRDTGSTL